MSRSDAPVRLRPEIDVPWPQAPTAFEETMLGLAHDPARPAVDLFSGACVEVFEHRRADRYDYPLGQVFEPDVLAEVALLAGLAPAAVASLEHAPTERIAALRAEVEDAARLTPERGVNLASALISVSRFDLAGRVIEAVRAGAPDARARFETAMLGFITDNRSADGTEAHRWFAAMREAVEEGGIPDARVVDACTQAVVWFLKRGDVSREDFAWFTRTGHRIVTERADTLPDSALSSWYRGVAMLPARLRRAASTRRAMENARQTAERVVSRDAAVYDRHLLKTYYESSVKEHLYVTRNEAEAERFARLLIELDELWSVSWGELGELMLEFGRLPEAAAAFDTAARLGPPYLRYHLSRAAETHERLDHPEEAARRRYALSLFADAPASVLADGLRLTSDARLRAHFTERLSAAGGRA